MEKGLRNISTTSQLLTHLSPYILKTIRKDDEQRIAYYSRGGPSSH